MADDMEALAAARADQQHAQLLHVAVDDFRQAADQLGHGRLVRPGHFLAAFDQANAEGSVVAQAVAHHVDIARLEHAQWQPSTGKQHGVQREQRQVVERPWRNF